MMNKKGAMFITVMILSMLMIFIAVSSSNMLLQDLHMAKQLKYSMQTQYLAEAGIAHALVKILAEGDITGGDLISSTPLGVGYYEVKISGDVVVVSENIVKGLIISTGTVGGFSKEVAVEVTLTLPDSLFYIMVAGNDLRLHAKKKRGSGAAADMELKGDLHANHNVKLDADEGTTLSVLPCGIAGCCTGRVTAGGTVKIKEKGTGTVIIADTFNPAEDQGVPDKALPQFDYAHYATLADWVPGETEADDGDDYYAPGGDDPQKEFDNEILRPANGIIYVVGEAKFKGTCELHGGIVANNIKVHGELTQKKTAHNRNVIIAKEGKIEVTKKNGTLTAEEVLIYAEGDFKLKEDDTEANITGAMITSANLSADDKRSILTYQHKVLCPDGLILPGAADELMSIESWNK